MSLRLRMVVLLGVVLALLSATSHLVHRWVILPGFLASERSQARKDIGRCLDGIKRDVEHLAGLARDWAAWDDTYAFAVDKDEQYIKANLASSTLTNNRLNLLVIARSDGALVWGQVFDWRGGEAVEAPRLLQTIVDPANRINALENPGQQVSGLLITEIGPMLFTSQAIVKTDNTGPVRGVMMMGRLLDEHAVAELAARTRVRLAVRPLTGDPIRPEDRLALEQLAQGGGSWLREDDPELIRGYALVRDVRRRPALLLQAEIPREISQRGFTAARVATGLTVLGGGAILVLIWLLLRCWVVTPLSALTRHAVRVGNEGNLNVRLNLKRTDEIGVLAREFDRMVDHLAQSRAQIVEMAHRAGMAEVATDVLHNVGNVLNTVNVTASLVTDKLRTSEVPSLGLAADLMAEHRDDLGTFLTEDERGRQLPGFLSELAGVLTAEHSSMLEEMKTLSTALDHIRETVSRQQTHAKGRPVLEDVEPETLLDEALRLNAESLERHGIRVERRVACLGPVRLDRHKVLLILTNLVGNARQALKESDRPDRRLLLELETQGEAEHTLLRVRVQDNGVGIPAENLPRIFDFGFSTRADGHGFGLHGAANLAREMGGSLKVKSEGIDQGAQFVLEVPTHRLVGVA